MSKENRNRLFKRSKPVVRSLEILDGENYSKDVGVMWAAYKAGSFQQLPKDLTQEQFLMFAENLQNKFQKVWLVDDSNKAFKSTGKGPVMLIGTNANGLAVTAEGIGFKWAKKANVIRAATAFLNMIRYSKKTGVCLVKSNKTDLPFFHGLKKYDVLYYVGRVSADEWLFAIRGRGSEGN